MIIPGYQGFELLDVKLLSDLDFAGTIVFKLLSFFRSLEEQTSRFQC